MYISANISFWNFSCNSPIHYDLVPFPLFTFVFNILFSLRTDDSLKLTKPSVTSPISGLLYLNNPNLEHMYLHNLDKTMQ